MKTLLSILLVGSLCCAPQALSQSDSANKQPDSKADSYVSINIQLGKLDESAQVLDAAIQRLSDSLHAISENPQNLEPQQILAVAALANTSNQLLAEFNQSIKNFAPAIRALKQPTSAMVAGWAMNISQNMIQPTIRSINSSVSTWIGIVITGLIISLLIVGTAFYVSMRHLRRATENLQKIAGDYTLVRTDSLK